MTTSNTDNQNFHKVTLTYGTIKDMKVEIPTMYNGSTYGFNADTMVRSFAKSFVKYMCEGAMVSDDVLFSSIGASNCREVMRLGFNEQAIENGMSDDAIAIFNKVMSDDNTWKLSCLIARYGEEGGLRKSFELQGVPEASINEMLKIICN